MDPPKHQPSVVLPLIPQEIEEEFAVDRDGLNRPLDMVLSAKLQDMKAATAVPYWKRASKEDANNSELIELRRKARSLTKDMENLLKLHERQEMVVADLRAKLKATRADAAARERQLELAHRTIERLAVDKNGLEAGDAAKKTYIRQLESRVAGARGVAELQALVARLRSDVASLQNQVKAAEDRAAAAEEAAEQHQAEAVFLRRGVQLAAEQLAKAGGGDVSAGLLLSVARGQNEAAEMAGQLAEAQAQIEEMAGALGAARTHLQTQHEALQQWQEWERSHAEAAAEREEALRVEREAGERARRAAEAATAAAAEARRERDAARHRLELEKTAREEAEAKARALHAALRRAEQAEASLRAEVQRLGVAQQAHAQALEEAQIQAEAAAAAAAAARSRRASPVKPRYGSPAKPTAAGLAPLDDSIAALEAELAALTANAGAMRPPSAPNMASPQVRINAAGGTWHTNPLASPTMSAKVAPQEAAENAAAGLHEPPAAPAKASAAQSLAMSEDAAWRLLEQRMEVQRDEDRRMNALWQGGGAPEASSGETATAADARAAGLRVEIPGAGGSPGVGSSRPGAPASPVALTSPDLGQLSARNADWLNGSADDGLRDFEPPQKTNDNATGVRVTVFAGMPAPPAPAAAAAPGRRPVRQSLFDLANIEIDD